mmetsp:Transcript_13775/g.34920  ORF Transcript_13775/g.34920 Transcript_13775/m.34920 type:complete len:93 (-) Transcript_13775:667-945(-)
MSMSERMVSAALRRWRISRYEEGSSNMYTFDCCTQTMQIAKRCSSPPESTSTSRSSTWLRSRTRVISAITSSPRSALEARILRTWPFTARGM